MKVVVVCCSGGGVFVEEKVGTGKNATTEIVKKLPGATVDLEDSVASRLMDAGVVKPFIEGASAPELPEGEPE